MADPLELALICEPPYVGAAPLQQQYTLLTTKHGSCVCLFETGSHYVSLAGLELTMAGLRLLDLPASASPPSVRFTGVNLSEIFRLKGNSMLSMVGVN